MKIKALRLEQFKGVADSTFEFGERTKICGQNGVGKSTISDAIYFLILGKNYQLKDNPEIHNFNLEESIPRVTAIFDFDGKEVTASKWQKCKKSKPDENGIVKVNYINEYSWNEVPLKEADFKQKFKNEGVDLDLFAELSHPDVFTKGLGDKKQREHMRETLFKMCNDYSDITIAGLYEETKSLISLLENYTVEEIEAMNKSTIKKANQELNSIPLQIIGMEKSKVDDSEASELELNKKAIEEKLNSLDSNFVLASLNDGKMNLVFEKNEYVRKQNQSTISKKTKMNHEILNMQVKQKEIESDIKVLEREKLDATQNVSNMNKQIATLQEKWKELSASQFKETFDESKYGISETDTFCRACGQKLPTENIERLVEREKNRLERDKKAFEDSKKRFEVQKKDDIDKVVQLGKTYAKSRDDYQKKISEIETSIEEKQKELEEIKKQIQKDEQKLSKMPDSVDLSGDEVYLSLMQKINEIDAKLEEIESASIDSENQKVELNAELEEIKNKLAGIANNAEIDKKIEELREQQIDFEQAKANSEKVLYQLDLLSTKKNLLLTDEINKHFSLVQFKLFDYQKNGEVKQVCIPLIDGKEFGVSMNTGLEILAKLDICNSLQKFYNMKVPVILDNAESINPEKMPEMESQLIEMRVTEDKELVIK